RAIIGRSLDSLAFVTANCAVANSQHARCQIAPGRFGVAAAVTHARDAAFLLANQKIATGATRLSIEGPCAELFSEANSTELDKLPPLANSGHINGRRPVPGDSRSCLLSPGFMQAPVVLDVRRRRAPIVRVL